MPTGRGVGLSTLVLILSACGGPGAAGPVSEYAIRDSADVRIVEYEGMPTPTHSITLSAPLSRHGHREGDYLFTMPYSGALQPDGTAVISDAINSEIVVIGPDGTLRSKLATEGQGPGEVRRGAELVAWGQDTIFVNDVGNRRITVFENGIASRNFPLIGVSSVTISGLDKAGRVLMTKTGFTPGFAEPWLQGPMIRFDPSSQAYDTIGEFDWIASPDMGGTNSPYRPEGRVAVSGGTFVHGRPDLPELVWRGPDGTVRQIVRWNPTPQYPSERHWEATISAIRMELSTLRMDHLIQGTIDRLEVDPDVPLPLFQLLHGDRDGRVWVEEFVSNFGAGFASVPSYQLISADGVWIGRLVSPPGFRMLDALGDRVLGVVRDELDVETVAVYELHITPYPR